MASPEELQRTLEARLTAAGYDAATLEQSPGSTIVPRRAAGDSAGGRAVEALGEIDEKSRLADRLELHGTIGEGGMGVVRLGVQRALARTVAVKTLRPERKSDAATLKLLREAWVTGSLEHPNVVPVYDIAIEPDGSPLIVLKKIEGTGWDELMHDPEALRERFGADDPLDWNLRVLMQLCNAVHFAHERGILHRDLKPENVMVGAFGEVYLVDWGIAVSLRDDGSGRLPLARNATEMAGTLLYMAPEMLGGKGAKLSERTDVYLLGAILYEIVAGRPPHRGSQVMELVMQILESDPPLSDDVPADLRRLVRGAMRKRPEERPEGAEAFRLELQSFLVHRDATVLAERADQRLDELEEMITGLTEEDMPEAREPVYHLFGECRFGYRHALEISSRSDQASAGLQRAIETMVRFELDYGEPEAAHALLGEAPEEVPALAAEVEAARRRRRAEVAALEAVRDQHDASLGRRTRVFAAIVVGSLWCVGALLPELFQHLGWIDTLTHPMSIAVESLALLTILVIGWWGRESMMRTQVNRLVGAGAVISMVTGILIHLGDWLSGSGDVYAAFRASFVAWFAMISAVAVAVERRALIPAAAFGVGFFVLGFHPRWAMYVLAVCNEILLWTLVWAWARREDIGYVHAHVRRHGARMSRRAGAGRASEPTAAD